jgi:hypothetical protein
MLACCGLVLMDAWLFEKGELMTVGFGMGWNGTNSSDLSTLGNFRAR